ncbi:hypothetical protein EI555_009994 [Monodon monoceros]|uniref:Homeobox domain-containing protein n=1 Tax=Monodon monoceros TaxID=40151 RepID=A0A4U1ELI5_MONMO|nr:hypothetical protein EI555_009994 [Monodon monoceros]
MSLGQPQNHFWNGKQKWVFHLLDVEERAGVCRTRHMLVAWTMLKCPSRKGVSTARAPCEYFTDHSVVRHLHGMDRSPYLCTFYHIHSLVDSVQAYDRETPGGEADKHSWGSTVAKALLCTGKILQSPLDPIIIVTDAHGGPGPSNPRLGHLRQARVQRKILGHAFEMDEFSCTAREELALQTGISEPQIQNQRAQHLKQSTSLPVNAPAEHRESTQSFASAVPPFSPTFFVPRPSSGGCAGQPLMFIMVNPSLAQQLLREAKTHNPLWEYCGGGRPMGSPPVGSLGKGQSFHLHSLRHTSGSSSHPQPQHSALPCSSNLLDELLLDTDILEKARPFLDVDLEEEEPLGTLSAPLSKEQFQALLYILAVKERKEKQQATLMILSCSKTKKRLVSGKLVGSTSIAKSGQQKHFKRWQDWAAPGVFVVRHLRYNLDNSRITTENR